ncbi:MAG: hypothetical protein IPN70_00175 [Candidatus Moraniibacteriota bacterium]|nr:MAG: hypothetical protein IPN70_00175 [Candidatus Moranbacteria bacterium]
MITSLEIKEEIMILEIREIIRDCISGDLERFPLLKEYPEDVVHIELISLKITGDVLLQWEDNANLSIFIKESYGCDYGILHPDETIEEFWDHEN